MVKPKVTLKDFFKTLQGQMLIQLEGARSVLTHPVTKGDATELNWIEWLREYLPKRYSVDKAIIIDSNNNFSEQIDLVIYDRQYSPFVFKQGGAIYIPAESVYAVFEVKQELNKQNIEYAGEKIKSVRVLSRTSAQITHAEGVTAIPKKPFEICGGILTTSAGWVEPFGEAFQDNIRTLDKLSQIDIGCVIDSGGFVINYIPAVTIKISTQEEALIYFFLKLLVHLQGLGTAPAMVIDDYARALDSI